SAGGSLAGAYPNPSIASGQVVKSLNALKDDVTLTAGSNVTITPSGNVLTIAAGAGALALPYQGSASVASPDPVFSIANTGTGAAIRGDAINQPALLGVSVNSRGVYGIGGIYGVAGLGNTGVWGTSSISFGIGVFGSESSGSGKGVYGAVGGGSGFAGNVASAGVHGDASASPG